MDGTNTPRPRTTEDDWLDAAYVMLTEAGVDAVKVMPLAKQLGVSRTSFYWHFKDRDALLEAMIQRWEDKNTGNVEARCNAYAETITEAIFNLFDCWLDDALFDDRLELAIRNWARTDATLQERLNRVDARRQAAMENMFTRFGYSSEQAHVRAMTMVFTQIGYYSLEVSEPFAERIARMPDYAQVFSGQPPAAREVERFLSRHTAT